jgi:hypothetical protein
MQSLGMLHMAEEKVLDDIKTLVSNMRHALKNDPNNVCDAAAMIAELRKLCYEDLNQIQHEYLILLTVNWLTRAHIVSKKAIWKWNPRQTGGCNEPDLQASVDGKVVLSAEITTSERPVGTIRTRMIRTLEKLRLMPGLHYYIVKSELMSKAAERFSQDACPDVRVLIINDSILAARHLVIPMKAVQDVELPYPAEPNLAESSAEPKTK